jgi:hypothetical protein
MTTPVKIPDEEQLRALTGGLVEVYKLIERHTGAPVTTDFRKFITVTKPELTAYLRRHPGVAERFVMSEETVRVLHDLPCLVAKGSQWLVCWTEHGRKADEQTFANLEEAAANYLMAYW